MKNNSKNAWLGLLICLVSATFCGCVSAAENYVGWHEDGVFYRFDNQSGEIHKLVKNPGGPPMWVKCEVLDRTQANKTLRNTQPLPTAPTAPAAVAVAHQSVAAPYIPAQRPQAAQIIDVGMNSLSNDPIAPIAPNAPKVASAAKGRLEIFDENDRNITDRIDDIERAKCRPEINAYDALHVSHSLKTAGDRIKGTIMIENKGNRKIDMMELTMTVRIMGKEKPIDYKRYIFADKAGCEKPPVPSFGASTLSVMQAVDLPMPTGNLNGMPDVRVTCIRFGDRE